MRKSEDVGGYSANSYWQSRVSICNNVIWCKCEDIL